jgi:bifunctional DNA-binding transcriptional regulator/antitoxin component of YhaV-PrlF toxin-antitoxin module
MENFSMTSISPSQPLEQYSIQLGSGGCLILPVSLQQQLNLKEGDRFILIVEADKSLRLVSLPEQVRKLQGLFKDIAPGVSLADELIQDRRQEVRQENQRSHLIPLPR